MIYNLFVIVVMLAFGIAWGSKGKGYGMFSSLLALVCTLAAGAIAFAFWEPITYGLLLKNVNPGTTMGGILEDTAFGIGLLAPFAVSLLVLRLVVDKVVSKNLRFGESANFAGGALFGLANGFITVGVITVGLGYMRIGPSLMGYIAIDDVETGSPVRAGHLWVHADDITVKVYEHLSVGSFGTGTPLALWQPRADEQGAMLRTNYKDASRVTMLPDQYEVVGKYTVEGELASLLADENKEQPQSIKYPDNSSPSGKSRIEGYIMKFTAAAKEKGGSVSVSPSQLRLLAMQGGEVLAVHPFAVLAQPETGKLGMHRFRFDTKGSVISSVGGKSETVFAFEFMVPDGYQTRTMLVKNIRTDLSGVSAYRDGAPISPRKRDEILGDGSLFKAFGFDIGGSLAGVDLAAAEGVSPTPQGNYPGVQNSQRIGISLLKSSLRSGVSMDSDNNVKNCEVTLTEADLAVGNTDEKLKVTSYAVARHDVGLVQIELSAKNAKSTYGRAVEFAGRVAAPQVFTKDGGSFDAVGYFYQDDDEIQIRYTPDRPIRAMTEVPQLSSIKRNQTLKLLFIVDRGANLAAVSFGGDAKSQRKFDGEGPKVK
jgi:hypothetical protein